MSKKIIKHNYIYRLIDANLNRLKEGLRVLEDIVRFFANDKRLTYAFKQIRHQLTSCLNQITDEGIIVILKERNVKEDVGKFSIKNELKREDILDIFLANAQRCKESIRVLEEFSKLLNSKTSSRLKTIRYKIYSLEKHSLEKLEYIRNNRSAIFR